MYELDDTIAAISSPSPGQRAIVRISGPGTIEKINQLFSPPISSLVDRRSRPGSQDTGHRAPEASLTVGKVTIDHELSVDATLYLFFAPHSYTGDDIAEIHIHTNAAVTEALMDNLLSSGGQIRMAGPGEFTARAYLNGKMDLTQAEAVNEVIVSSNKFQLAASEKLLAGRLGQTTSRIRSELMDCLSLIEAGLDFSGEEIEFITGAEAVDRLTQIQNELERLLSGSVSYEELVDLPAVGIAGAPNAGKSSLLNKLLGKERSIVSELRKTTRDVLTGVLTLAHSRCVLFDCAGLIRAPNNILDELAQQAAIEALRNSSVVVFCVDIAKADWYEDISIRTLIEPQFLIPVATKSDMVSEEVLARKLVELKELFAPLETQREKSLTGFASEFLPTSAETGTGIELLRETIDRKLLDPRYSISDTRTLGREQRASRISTVRKDSQGGRLSTEHPAMSVALTARHRQAVTEAIENVSESLSELKAGNDEITAMMLRAAYQGLCDIESATGGFGRADEQILEKIFSSFCIGK